MFQDINQDGIDEFVKHDPAFFYYNMYCANATSPFTKVIYQFTTDRGYFPASPNFPEQYRDDIEKDQKRIEVWVASPSSPSGRQLFREANQCELLFLLLDYLYSGQPEKAWNALDRYYLYDNKAQFKADIKQKINKSPHFARR